MVHDLACLNGLRVEALYISVDQPVGELVTEEVAFAARVTLDVRVGAEVLHAASRAGQVLSASHGTDGVHNETVSRPELFPAIRAFWGTFTLTVYGNGQRGCIAHGTTTDVGCNLVTTHWHHWGSSLGGQPVRRGGATGVVTLVANTTEHERHWTELCQARTSGTQVLNISPTVVLSM